MVSRRSRAAISSFWRRLRPLPGSPNDAIHPPLRHLLKNVLVPASEDALLGRCRRTEGRHYRPADHAGVLKKFGRSSALTTPTLTGSGTPWRPGS